MRPDIQATARALYVVKGVLGKRRARYLWDGRFEFRLKAGWTLTISPDDAGRFRLDAAQRGRVRATMWCLADDHERLAALVATARDEAAALVA